jgi:hypothetical protein
MRHRFLKKVYPTVSLIIDFSLNTNHFIPTCACEEFLKVQMRIYYRKV